MKDQAANRMMRLGAFVHETGQHVAAWRHPDAFAESGTVFAQAKHVAQTAERGLFDLLFLADSAAVSVHGSAESRGRMGKTVKFEPITMLSALAAVTNNLGLVATCTSTYNEPYTLARQFASLDQISGGRAGWNLVTSNNEAEAFNHGREKHVSHADRYDRAAEFAEVVNGLWDSWEPDAFIRDKESGVYYDPSKLHVLNHRGKHFAVRGPLNVACSPQGRPVLVQAGASDTGRDLAAKLAELETKSGIQLVVATVASLDGEEIEPYANALFRHWALGQKDKNNGVLLLVAPKERRVRIEVGYGLEGTLTDALSKVIIVNAMAPRFKAGDFGDGIVRGVDDIITVLTTDASEWQKQPSLRLDSQETRRPTSWIGFVVFLVVIVLLIVSPTFRAIFFASLLSGRSGGSRGGFGGSGGSGGSGGGFSGGGGSSGGGGASGGW